MSGSTTRLSLYKPGGGSSGAYGADETADIDKLNDNADKIDAAMGARNVTSTTRPATPYDGQLIKETDTGKLLVWRQAAGQWEATGIELKGTAAQRDLYWGGPSNAAQRVLLANSIARWYNTDKQYVQQYYAQFDDAGVTFGTPARTVFGWGPAEARTQLKPTSIASTGGTAAVYHGDKVVCVGNTLININGLFTGEFENYEVIISGSLSASGLLGVRLRAAGADFAGATAHAYQTAENAAGVAGGSRQTGTDRWFSNAINAQETLETTMLLQRPATADARKRYRSETMAAIGANVSMDRVGGFLLSTTVFDGFSLIPSAGAFTGTLHFVGLRD